MTDDALTMVFALVPIAFIFAGCVIVIAGQRMDR